MAVAVLEVLEADWDLRRAASMAQYPGAYTSQDPMRGMRPFHD